MTTAIPRRESRNGILEIALYLQCSAIIFVQLFINNYLDFPSGASGKELACQCRRCKIHVFDPGSGTSPGEGKGNPLRYSCLGNSTDREAWRVTVLGVARCRTRLSTCTNDDKTMTSSLTLSLSLPVCLPSSLPFSLFLKTNP